MENKLVLKDVKLLFVEIKDQDFGSSITIDVTDEALKAQIEQFFTSEGLKPKFKDYTNKEGKTTKQFSIKLASFVKVQDEAGVEFTLDELEDKAGIVGLSYGSIISVSIRPYNYDNKFGKGKSASVTAVRIVKSAERKEDMNDLF